MRATRRKKFLNDCRKIGDYVYQRDITDFLIPPDVPQFNYPEPLDRDASLELRDDPRIWTFTRGTIVENRVSVRMWRRTV